MTVQLAAGAIVPCCRPTWGVFRGTRGPPRSSELWLEGLISVSASLARYALFHALAQPQPRTRLYRLMRKRSTKSPKAGGNFFEALSSVGGQWIALYRFPRKRY